MLKYITNWTRLRRLRRQDRRMQQLLAQANDRRMKRKAGLIPYDERMDPGIVELAGDSLRLRTLRYGNGETAVDDIVLVGEYTTQDGPFWFDHFVVLVERDGSWREVPTEAEGLEETIELLEKRLSFRFRHALVGSVDFASDVSWPAELAGRPLFDFVRIRQTWWEEARCFWIPRVRHKPTSDVRDYLAAASRG